MKVNERRYLFVVIGVRILNGYTMMSVLMLRFAICNALKMGVAILQNFRLSLLAKFFF